MTIAPMDVTAAVAPAAQQEPDALRAWIVRRRWAIFLGVALLYVLAFNGQWRVGRDSSLYRAVARNLASGEGYTFRGERQTHIFPGLPLILAGLNTVVGEDPLRPVPALLFMTGLALVTLVVVYHLIATHYPPWTAVCVAAAMGIHWRYLEQANELMTDLPFVFGVCLSLLGLERLRQGTRRGRIMWAVLMLVGLIVAAAMRPTFWALAAAWVATSAWWMLRGGHRWFWGLALATIFAVAVAWLALDPRTSHLNPFGGRYETEVLARLGSVDVRSAERVVRLLEEHLPEALFGSQLLPDFGSVLRSLGYEDVSKSQAARLIPGLNSVLSLMLLAAAFAVIRRAPLWGLLVIVTVAMNALVGAVPRYFLMVLPFLLLGWITLLESAGRRLARCGWRPQWVMLAGLLLLAVLNLGKDIGFVAEQHGLTSDGFKPFLAVYREGKMQPMVELANAIRWHVPPGQTVLGPEPTILSYLSGRNVYALREVHRGKRLSSEPLLAAKRTFQWAVFPASVYQDRDLGAWRLMRQRKLACAADPKPISIGEMRLGRLSVHGLPKRTKPKLTPAQKARRLRRLSTMPATTWVPTRLRAAELVISIHHDLPNWDRSLLDVLALGHTVADGTSFAARRCALHPARPSQPALPPDPRAGDVRLRPSLGRRPLPDVEPPLGIPICGSAHHRVRC